jgi:hypothetical protein
MSSGVAISTAAIPYELAAALRLRGSGLARLSVFVGSSSPLVRDRIAGMVFSSDDVECERQGATTSLAARKAPTFSTKSHLSNTGST